MTTVDLRSGTGHQARYIHPISGLRIRGQVPVACLDEPAEVPCQNKPLGYAPDWTERGRELDAVNHFGSRRVLAELMDVREPPERALDLLVDEKVRRLHPSDPACHAKRDTEMLSPPRDLFSQGDEAGPHAGDGILP
jgi:hypothetical protein